ncbi:Fic family protein, partial [Candidatus Micrarchaeota archaeon]|nr:Fic family protein [Candidatus Micrarchaeota archaeon]
MAYFSTKNIKGRDYLYAVQSVRMPGGRVAKLSKLVKNKGEARRLNGFFERKKLELFSKNAGRLELSGVHDENAVEKMEAMRLEYQNILRKLSQNQRKDLFDSFTVNFTYESNALEGNSLTLRQVAIVIHENASIKDKDLREIYETRNARRVVDLILKKKLRATQDGIKKMHSMLVADMGIEKGYKKLPNYLHRRQVITTLPEEVGKEMNELLEWLAQSKGKIHPLQLAAQFHGRFEQ